MLVISCYNSIFYFTGMSPSQLKYLIQNFCTGRHIDKKHVCLIFVHNSQHTRIEACNNKLKKIFKDKKVKQ